MATTGQRFPGREPAPADASRFKIISDFLERSAERLKEKARRGHKGPNKEDRLAQHSIEQSSGAPSNDSDTTSQSASSARAPSPSTLGTEHQDDFSTSNDPPQLPELAANSSVESLKRRVGGKLRKARKPRDSKASRLAGKTPEVDLSPAAGAGNDPQIGPGLGFPAHNKDAHYKTAGSKTPKKSDSRSRSNQNRGKKSTKNGKTAQGKPVEPREGGEDEDQDQDQDEDDGDDSDPENDPEDPSTTEASRRGKKLLVCPYYRMDPVEYAACILRHTFSAERFGDLVHHIRRCHTHVCPVCGHMFKDKGRLNNHLRKRPKSCIQKDTYPEGLTIQQLAKLGKLRHASAKSNMSLLETKYQRLAEIVLGGKADPNAWQSMYLHGDFAARDITFRSNSRLQPRVAAEISKTPGLDVAPEKVNWITDMFIDKCDRHMGHEHQGGTINAAPSVDAANQSGSEHVPARPDRISQEAPQEAYEPELEEWCPMFDMDDGNGDGLAGGVDRTQDEDLHEPMYGEQDRERYPPPGDGFFDGQSPFPYGALSNEYQTQSNSDMAEFNHAPSISNHPDLRILPSEEMERIIHDYPDPQPTDNLPARSYQAQLRSFGMEGLHTSNPVSQGDFANYLEPSEGGTHLNPGPTQQARQSVRQKRKRDN